MNGAVEPTGRFCSQKTDQRTQDLAGPVFGPWSVSPAAQKTRSRAGSSTKIMLTGEARHCEEAKMWRKGVFTFPGRDEHVGSMLGLGWQLSCRSRGLHAGAVLRKIPSKHPH
jgi:hypothetical protein